MNPTPSFPATTPAFPVNGHACPSRSEDWFWQVNWGSIEEAVTAIFENLRKQALQAWPRLKSELGRSSSSNAPFVFYYCTFEDPSDDAIDPVVFGITFETTTAESTISIKTGIAGESSGDVFFEGSERLVANSLPDIIAAATELTEELKRHAELIPTALQQPSYPPEADALKQP